MSSLLLYKLSSSSRERDLSDRLPVPSPTLHPPRRAARAADRAVYVRRDMIDSSNFISRAISEHYYYDHIYYRPS